MDKNKNEYKISKMNNRKKSSKGVIIFTLLSILIIAFFGVNVYAKNVGYPNIFDFIESHINKEEVLADKVVNITDEYTEIEEGVYIRVNKFVIENNVAKLLIDVKFLDDVSNNIKPNAFYVYDANLNSVELTELASFSSEKYKTDDKYTEEITLENYTKNVTSFYIKVNNTKGLMASFKVYLSDENTTIKVEECDYQEILKVSEEELKEVLSHYAKVNIYNDYKESLDQMYNNVSKEDSVNYEILEYAVELINLKEVGETTDIVYTLEKVNKAIEEMTGQKISGNISVGAFSNGFVHFNADTNSYELDAGDGGTYPYCLEIESLDYSDKIYTVKFKYCYANDGNFFDDTIDDLSVYETTMKFAINENYTYTKYLLKNVYSISSTRIKDGSDVKAITGEDYKENQTQNTVEDTNINVTVKKNTDVPDIKTNEIKAYLERIMLMNYYKDNPNDTSEFSEDMLNNEMKVYTAFKLDFDGNVANGITQTELTSIDSNTIYEIIKAYTGEDFGDNNTIANTLIRKDYNYFSYIDTESNKLSCTITDVENIEYVNDEYVVTFRYAYSTNLDQKYRTTVLLKEVSPTGLAKNYVKYQLVETNIESGSIN